MQMTICTLLTRKLSDTVCPSCHQNYNGLSIESSSELQHSRIKCSECGWDYGDSCDEETLTEQFFSLKFATHNSWLGVNYDDVKVAETIDMEAGCFLERKPDNVWVQWDGGYGIECTEAEVREWLKEAMPVAVAW